MLSVAKQVRAPKGVTAAAASKSSLRAATLLSVAHAVPLMMGSSGSTTTNMNLDPMTNFEMIVTQATNPPAVKIPQNVSEVDLNEAVRAVVRSELQKQNGQVQTSSVDQMQSNMQVVQQQPMQQVAEQIVQQQQPMQQVVQQQQPMQQVVQQQQPMQQVVQQQQPMQQVVQQQQPMQQVVQQQQPMQQVIQQQQQPMQIVHQQVAQPQVAQVLQMASQPQQQMQLVQQPQFQVVVGRPQPQFMMQQADQMIAQPMGQLMQQPNVQVVMDGKNATSSVMVQLQRPAMAQQQQQVVAGGCIPLTQLQPQMPAVEGLQAVQGLQAMQGLTGVQMVPMYPQQQRRAAPQVHQVLDKDVVVFQDKRGQLHARVARGRGLKFIRRKRPAASQASMYGPATRMVSARTRTRSVAPSRVSMSVDGGTFGPVSRVSASRRSRSVSASASASASADSRYASRSASTGSTYSSGYGSGSSSSGSSGSSGSSYTTA